MYAARQLIVPECGIEKYNFSENISSRDKKLENLTPIKVLHLIPRMVPSPEGILVGGSVNAMLNLINSTLHDFDSVVYSNTDLGFKHLFAKVKIKTPIIIEENSVVPGTTLYGLNFLIKGLSSIIKHKAWEADIINGHSGFPLYGLISAMAGRALGKPTIHTLYCPVQDQSNWFNKKLSYFSLICNDKILAMSDNVKKSLMTIGIPSEKIEVVPPFIDTVKFSPENYSSYLRNQLGISSDEPIILFVGNLKQSKGLDILIDALSMLTETSFKFVFTLELKSKDFDTKLRRMLQKVSNCGLKDRTIQLGIIDVMPALMASVDLIVVPYRDTNGPSDHPIALMEAIASGIAAVGTKVGGIPELIEENVTGFLVEPGNATALAGAIKKLVIDRKLRKKFGSNARKKSIESFKYENINKTITMVYRTLLNKGV